MFHSISGQLKGKFGFGQVKKKTWDLDKIPTLANFFKAPLLQYSVYFEIYDSQYIQHMQYIPKYMYDS